MRTRILSDVHLGHSASRVKSVEMLAPLLDGCDHLVLAGDMWEGRMTGARYENSRDMYDQFLEMVDARGISLQALRGNHDPQTGDGVAWLAEGAILVTHGDAIYDDATPWSREMPIYRQQVDDIVREYADRSGSAEACSDRAYEIATIIKSRPLPKLPSPLNFFATAFWPPSRSFQMFRVWRGMSRQGLRFLKHSGAGAKVLICGHFHRSGFWEREGSLMINTGAFMRGCQSWVVDVDIDRKITAREVVKKDGRFHLGVVRERWQLR